MFRLCILICVIFVAVNQATDVKRCDANKPFPLGVRVQGCEMPPCDIIKGGSVVMEIDFVTNEYITKATTMVRAKTLGITVPYELPDEVRDVCPNLMFGAYCPLYPTEDVTYLFLFPVGNYPEISVNIEISIVDQDANMVTCFKCDIKVKKGNSGGSKAIYQLNWLGSTLNSTVAAN